MHRCTNLIAIFVVVLCACHTLRAEPAADDSSEEGFVTLFDGKTLDGWEIMNGGKFSAEDGVIKLNGGRGWLRSKQEYSDFVLKVELRFLKKNQDSGIFLRASEEGKGWPSRRYEVQAHNDKSMVRIFGAAHKRDAELVAKLLHETDEWNRFEIHCAGPKLAVKFNGQVVTTAEGLKNPRGYIGLQGEGGLLEFRNIRIKPLRSAEAGK